VRARLGSGRTKGLASPGRRASLMTALAGVPDLRRAAGRRRALPAVLAFQLRNAVRWTKPAGNRRMGPSARDMVPRGLRLPPVHAVCQQCFADHFSHCAPAKVNEVVPGLATYRYDIVGPGPDDSWCAMTSRFLVNPNPKWVGKEMTCLYDTTLEFSMAGGPPPRHENERPHLWRGVFHRNSGRSSAQLLTGTSLALVLVAPVAMAAAAQAGGLESTAPENLRCPSKPGPRDGFHFEAEWQLQATYPEGSFASARKLQTLTTPATSTSPTRSPIRSSSTVRTAKRRHSRSRLGGRSGWADGDRRRCRAQHVRCRPRDARCAQALAKWRS